MEVSTCNAPHRQIPNVLTTECGTAAGFSLQVATTVTAEDVLAADVPPYLYSDTLCCLQFSPNVLCLCSFDQPMLSILVENSAEQGTASS